MKEVIITTLGHVDHGKTSLIYNLTGKDTDTLKEEKERGLSIDLGFTYIDLPSRLRCSIIDVPGHKKYIKNMLAGVFNMDLALLVIDINEGIMMQTRNHVNILRILNTKNVIVVLTKVDLDRGYSKKREIEEFIKDKLPIDTPIIEFSNKTKEGLPLLRETIDRYCTEIQKREDIKRRGFYMPIDRVFSLKGHGTIVTGTFQGDEIRIGQEVMVYPKEMLTKIRNIQNHSDNLSKAYGTLRVAINLSGPCTKEINRGDVIAKKDSLKSSDIIDTSFKYILENSKPLKNNERLCIHLGTNEVFARVCILGKGFINCEGEELVQLRLEKKITVIQFEKFIARRYSRGEVIGGGIIINPCGRKAKSKDVGYKNFLNSIYISGANKRDFDVKDRYYDIFTLVRKYHDKHPYSNGIKVENMLYLINYRKYGDKKAILDKLLKGNYLVNNYGRIAIPGFYISLSKRQNRLLKNIEDYFDVCGLKVPKIKTYLEKNKDTKDFKSMFNLLLEDGKLIKLNEDYVISKKTFKEYLDIVKVYLHRHNFITISEGKEILNLGRKTTVIFLEYLDSSGITVREDGIRKLKHK